MPLRGAHASSVLQAIRHMALSLPQALSKGEGTYPVGREMRPPFTVELWKPVDDKPHLLAITEGFEAAENAYQNAIADLRVGEVVRVRDGLGTLLLSTDEDDLMVD